MGTTHTHARARAHTHTHTHTRTHQGIFIRKIDVVPKNVHWNASGELCLLVCEDTCYVLKYDAGAVSAAIDNSTFSAEEGVEGAFELLHELSDSVQTGEWVGDCFLYTNNR